MRQIINIILVFIVGGITVFSMERKLTDLSEMTWRYINVGCVIGWVIVAILCDPIYSRLKNPQIYQISSTILVSLLIAILVGGIWWFLILPIISDQPKEISELSIEHDEKNPDYYLNPYEVENLKKQLGPDASFHRDLRVGKISIFNPSKTEVKKNVKVKFTNIDPRFLQDFPFEFKLTDDGSPKNLNPEDRIFVDIVQYDEYGHRSGPHYRILCESDNIITDVRIIDEDYRITIEVTSASDPKVSRDFHIGMRNKNNKGEMMYLWPVDQEATIKEEGAELGINAKGSEETTIKRVKVSGFKKGIDVSDAKKPTLEDVNVMRKEKSD